MYYICGRYFQSKKEPREHKDRNHRIKIQDCGSIAVTTNTIWNHCSSSGAVFMIPFSTIFTSEDWDYGGGDGSTEWAEQFLHLELHMQWKRKRNGSPFAMLWTNQIKRSLMRCLTFLNSTFLLAPIPVSLYHIILSSCRFCIIITKSWRNVSNRLSR